MKVGNILLRRASMSSDVEARITLRDLIKPELGAYAARIEVLEREKTAPGQFVEVMDSSWLSELESRIMVESDRYIADLLISHANVMTALILHRRILNLERARNEDTH